MSPIETKITEVALRRIRALRSDQVRSERAEGCSSAPDVAKIREAQFSDFESVCALCVRLGQGPDSLENWWRLWRDNPALGRNRRSSIGWVLEASGNVVGFLGSVPLQYSFHGSTLQAVASCRFAVEPIYRAYSHLLIFSFFRQKDIDLYLNTTATPAAAKMMIALKASPMPQLDYDKMLFWVVNARGFAGTMIEKLGAHFPMRSAGAKILAGALNVDRSIRERAPRARSSRYEIRASSVGALGPEFSRLLSEESSALQAARSAEIMRWHFDPPANRRSVVVLGCYAANSELLGYLIVRHDAEIVGELRRSLIADLIVRRDDPEVIGELLAAAWESSRSAGCHVLEFMGFPGRIRKVAQRWKPYQRQYPAHPFYFKAQDRNLHQALLEEAVWYASPFDGDTTLWP